MFFYHLQASWQKQFTDMAKIRVTFNQGQLHVVVCLLCYLKIPERLRMLFCSNWLLV